MKYQSNIQRLSSTSIHDWYRFVYAYSDQLVEDLLDEFEADRDDLVLDPFNGTGTTTVVAKRNGIDSIGLDASPAGVLAGKVKTTWTIDIEDLHQRRIELQQTIEPVFKRISAEGNTTLESFGGASDVEDVSLESYNFEYPDKVGKGWLSEKPLRKMLVLRHHVDQLPDDDITDVIRLAMVAILPEDVGNVGFGPEIYKVSKQEDVDVLSLFDKKMDKIERDLKEIQSVIADGFEPGTTEVFNADARVMADELRSKSDLLNQDKHAGEVDYVITSPPYPAEHDYTRNQRMELVWLGVLEDNQDLQRIKKRNIRSNTKNIYVKDDDGEQTHIRDLDSVDEIVTEMEQIIDDKDISHGFGQYYPRVIEEYFGGMQRHFEQLYELLADGGKAAYVVADQASYWQVQVATGEILGEIAEKRAGFDIEGIVPWRKVAATTGRREDLEEEMLIIRKPSAN